MKINTTLFAALGLALFATLFTACEEQEFDAPPARVIPEGQLLTLADLRQIEEDSGTYKFTEDFNLYATVTADGVSGNFFRNVYVQDSTGAINLRTIEPDGLYIGDYFRVNLKGSTVSKFSEMLQLDSVDVDTQVVIQSTQNFIQPKTVTLGQIDESLQAQLIRVENVEFSNADLNTTFADAVNLGSENKDLVDCNGGTVLFRTSGFSSFADQVIPSGNGSVVGVVSQFNDDFQIFIRNTNDLNMDSLRCDGTTGNEQAIVLKDFEDQSLESGGWSQEVIAGGNDWYISSFNDNFYARASAFNGGNNGVTDFWLISPAFDLASLNAPFLSFTMTTNFNGPALETYVCTDYDEETGVSGATWTLLDDIDYPTNVPTWTTVSSGPVDLTPFSSATTRVAFRYTSTDDEAATWDVDNIGIFDN